MRPSEVGSRLYADFLMPSRLDAYRSTLELALAHGYRVMSVDGFWRLLERGAVDSAKRYAILRHDIDTDPDTGRAIWEIDRSLGVSSSYYFRLSTLDAPFMATIHGAGGEASYHYEELATIAKERRIRNGQAALDAIPEAQDRFRENLARVRALTGLPILTVASHGDFTNRRLRIPNWAILVDRGFRREVGVDLETYDDAFMTHVTSRFSDSGPLGAWSPSEAGEAILAHAPVVYLLVHPRQWRVGRQANLRNDLERIAEGARYAVGLRRRGIHPHTHPATPAGTAGAAPAPAHLEPAPASGPRQVLEVALPDGYEPERRYVLDVVLREWLGLDYVMRRSGRPQVEIGLEGDQSARCVTLPDTLFATPPADWLTERAMPVTPLRRVRRLGVPQAADGRGVRIDGDVLLDPLPVPYGSGDDEAPFAIERPGGLDVTVDVFGSVFFLLTRFEELARPAEDDHGRFPAYASLATIEGFLERPIADDLVELLWWALQTAWPGLRRRATQYRLNLTHDVDQPWAVDGLSASAVMRSLSGDVLRRRDAELALRRTRTILEAGRAEVSDDPFDTFDLLMDTSEEIGTRSTFYIQASRTSSAQSATYDLGSKRIARLLRRIHDRGHQIGLHGSYQSYLSAEALSRELGRLDDACRAVGIEQTTWSGRQHYLRFSNPMTWRAQAAAGLVSDSTLGFADAVGFRASTCRPFPVFDLRDRRPLGLLEQPIVIMDVTLLAYLGLDGSSVRCRVRDIVRRTRDHGGEATMCYHNSTIVRRRDQAGYRQLIHSLQGDAQ